MTNNEVNEAAIAYAKGGWKVLPVDPTTKRPLTKHGVLDATADPAEVRTVFGYLTARDGTSPSIATPTGDGLLVIDIDPRNGGERKPWMPATREVQTQSGGTHLHYRIDVDIKSRANLFGPGIDSKCRGGYVLIPPSRGYEWINNMEPFGIVEQYLSRYVDPVSFPGGPQGGAARKRPQDWRKGMIHDQVIAWAAFLAGDAMEERDVTSGVWDLVRAAQEAGCQIDNAGEHIDKAIEWVLARERNSA